MADSDCVASPTTFTGFDATGFIDCRLGPAICSSLVWPTEACSARRLVRPEPQRLQLFAESASRSRSNADPYCCHFSRAADLRQLVSTGMTPSDRIADQLPPFAYSHRHRLTQVADLAWVVEKPHSESETRPVIDGWCVRHAVPVQAIVCLAGAGG